MTTIALGVTGFSSYSFGGLGAFASLDSTFSSAKKASSNLVTELANLKISIDVASVAVNVESSVSQVQAARTREETKSSSLTLAYGKLDEYIKDVGEVDQTVSFVVSGSERDFYKQYSYLKPECKKSLGEKICDFVTGVVVACVNFIIELGEWIADHIVAILTVIVIVVVAFVLTAFLGPAAVIAIMSAIAFFCSMIDLGCSLITGKDFYTFLVDSGHPFLAELFAGVEWGATIAATAVGLYSLGSQIAKVGLRNFLTGGEKGFGNIVKYHFKNLAKGIKADWDSVFGHNLKFGQRAKAVWNIVVLNQSGDFNFKQSILDFRQEAQSIIRKTKHIEWDNDNNLIYAKSDKLKDALTNIGVDPTEPLITVKYGNAIDYDWTEYGGYLAGETDFMSLYSNDKAVALFDNDQCRYALQSKSQALQSQSHVPKVSGYSRHEIYNVEKGVVQIYQVPTAIHDLLKHNGGTSVVLGIYKDLAANTLFMSEREALRRVISGDALGEGLAELGKQIYSWTH